MGAGEQIDLAAADGQEPSHAPTGGAGCRGMALAIARHAHLRSPGYGAATARLPLVPTPAAGRDRVTRTDAWGRGPGAHAACGRPREAIGHNARKRRRGARRGRGQNHQGPHASSPRGARGAPWRRPPPQRWARCWSDSGGKAWPYHSKVSGQPLTADHSMVVNPQNSNLDIVSLVWTSVVRSSSVSGRTHLCGFMRGTIRRKWRSVQ